MKNVDITELVKQALVDLGVIAKRPAYATMDQWCIISGMSRRSTYRALGRGLLRAKKSGTRTLIDVEHGLRYLQSLPDAEIHAPKPQSVAA